MNGSVPCPTVVSAPRTPPKGPPLPCAVAVARHARDGRRTAPPVLHVVFFAVLFAGFMPAWDGEFWLALPLAVVDGS